MHAALLVVAPARGSPWVTWLVAAILALIVCAVVSAWRRAWQRRHALDALACEAAVDDAMARRPASMKGPVELALVMPAYNEADNLRELLPGWPRELLGRTTHLIVVDDGSLDDTARVAAEHGAWPIRLPTNRGGGSALRTGFAAARRLGARHVITLDADGQHRFEDLPAVLAPLRDGAAHVVIGSRRLGRSLDTSHLRNLGVRVFSAVVSRLTGHRITDCASGLRGLEVASLGRLSLCQARHHTAELIIEAARHGLVIVEVPITIASRRRGTSKKGSSVVYALRFTATILSTWLRR
jgi:glycosyltransferase involved in cell wall biosynthesis